MPNLHRGRRRSNAWDKVFASSYFSERDEPKAQDSAKLLKVASVAPPDYGVHFSERATCGQTSRAEIRLMVGLRDPVV